MNKHFLGPESSCPECGAMMEDGWCPSCGFDIDDENDLDEHDDYDADTTF